MAKRIKRFGLDSFVEKHSFAATLLLCLFSLFFTQNHYISRDKTTGVSGEVAFVWQAPVFVLFALLLYAFAVFVKEREPSVYKRALYIAAAFGAVFLTCRVIAALNGPWRKAAFAALAVLLFALFAVLILKKNRIAGVLALASCLGFSAAFGLGPVLFALSAGIYGLFLGLDEETPKYKSLYISAAVVVSLVAAYVCCALLDDPITRFVTAGFIFSFGIFLARSLRGDGRIAPIITLMFALGLVMRFAYVLDVTLPQRQHDVFNFFNRDSRRHNTYILYIYEHWSLPAEGVYNAGLSQYYHPPFYHFVAALWMKAQTLMGFSVAAAYENVQYLTAAFSACLMVAGYKLFEELRLKGAALYAAFAVIAFHPTFYIFAGSVNNDPLTTLFLFLAVLYTVRWYRDKSVKNTVLLALFIGLGMMTKLSGAVIAFGTGFVFLRALFTKRTGGFLKNLGALWKKFVLFGAIAFPLGLWWPIRCYIKFGMPLGYVPSLGLNSDQYVGNYSVLQRLTGIGSLAKSGIYPNVGGGFTDYGIAPYILKTSLFGEYFGESGLTTMQNTLGYALFFSSLVLIAISLFGLAAGVVSLFRADGGFIGAENKTPFAFLAVYYFFLVGSYVVFCFKYPHTCTMDFRYIAPTVLIGAAWLGLAVNGSKNWAKPLRRVLTAAAVVFSLSSVAFYTLSF